MAAPSTPDTEQQSTAQDFLAFLSGIRKGGSATEAGEKLQQLVAAIAETGKGGTLTLRLTVKPAGKSGALTVADEVLLKAPALPKPDSMFFPDENHNLVRNPPNQFELL